MPAGRAERCGYWFQWRRKLAQPRLLQVFRLDKLVDRRITGRLLIDIRHGWRISLLTFFCSARSGRRTARQRWRIVRCSRSSMQQRRYRPAIFCRRFHHQRTLISSRRCRRCTSITRWLTQIAVWVISIFTTKRAYAAAHRIKLGDQSDAPPPSPASSSPARHHRYPPH